MIRLFPERGGWLEVICGPMFSGKSEELIRRLRRAEIAGQRALIVKPRIDDRYDIGHVVSHAGAKMRAVAVSRPEDIPGLAEAYDVIGIDEVQFFTPPIVLVVAALVERGEVRDSPEHLHEAVWHSKTLPIQPPVRSGRMRRPGQMRPHASGLGRLDYPKWHEGRCPRRFTRGAPQGGG